MRCWRNIGYECAEEDCPMWIDKDEMLKSSELDSREMGKGQCILVIGEQIKFFKSVTKMLQWAEEHEEEEEIDEELMANFASHERPIPRTPQANVTVTSDVKNSTQPQSRKVSRKERGRH
jgi:hypothetical protein